MKREGEGVMKGERQTAEHNSMQGKVCNVCSYFLLYQFLHYSPQPL